MSDTTNTQTPTRLATWEYLVTNTASYWPRQKAEAAMALADEEQAELVAENQRLRNSRAWFDDAYHTADEKAGVLGSRAEAAELEVQRVATTAMEFAEEAHRKLTVWQQRTEAAEAKVARVEKLATEWSRKAGAAEASATAREGLSDADALWAFVRLMDKRAEELRAALADGGGE